MDNLMVSCISYTAYFSEFKIALQCHRLLIIVTINGITNTNVYIVKIKGTHFLMGTEGTFPHVYLSVNIARFTGYPQWTESENDT